VEEDRSFDIVISNHLVHHLKQHELKMICKHAEKLSSKKVIFNDIERSDIGYASFKVAATPLFRNSFIVEDGLTSIKRSFRKDELQQALPNGWEVQRQFLYRLLAIYDAS
jgi:2-polyprenyl-3-methyl-5-hydroxy-6-metoxy-1,4-benzoquinol methylase